MADLSLKAENLSTKAIRFCELVARGEDPEEAARATGFKAKSVPSLLKKPAVKEYLAQRANFSLATVEAYNTPAAMAELAEAMAFARETKNATALARCIELRARLSGLLTEKQSAQTQFKIVIAGLDPMAPTPIPDPKNIEG